LPSPGFMVRRSMAHVFDIATNISPTHYVAILRDTFVLHVRCDGFNHRGQQTRALGRLCWPPCVALQLSIAIGRAPRQPSELNHTILPRDVVLDNSTSSSISPPMYQVSEPAETNTASAENYRLKQSDQKFRPEECDFWYLFGVVKRFTIP
jgi:hypothetical protein